MKFQLEADITLGEGARQIKLPVANYKLKDGQPLHVLGWGKAVKGKKGTRLAKLQDLRMYNIANKKCVAYFRQAKNKEHLDMDPDWVLEDQTICASAIDDVLGKKKISTTKDSCAGDSGSPLIQAAQDGVGGELQMFVVYSQNFVWVRCCSMIFLV